MQISPECPLPPAVAPTPAPVVTVGSPSRHFSAEDRAQEMHNLWIAVAGLVVAIFPFVLHFSTGNTYADFTITLIAAGGFGCAKRFLQDNQRTIVLPPPAPTPPPVAPALPPFQNQETKP